MLPQLSLCVQGEQCNVVPDNIDDIVADIGQEDKVEGTVNTYTHTHFHLRIFRERAQTRHNEFTLRA